MHDSSLSKLLLVEPEVLLADLTAFRLELLGYRIETVSNGVEAEDRLHREHFDLLIVDTKLPEGEGIEWLDKIRLEYKPEDVPVLMFSLDPSLETVRRAFLAGAQDYLITPFDPTILESKIQALLTLSVTSR